MLVRKFEATVSSHAIRATALFVVSLAACGPRPVPVAGTAIRGIEHTCHVMTFTPDADVELCGLRVGQWNGRELVNESGEREAWLRPDGSLTDRRGWTARHTSDGSIEVVDDKGALVASAAVDEAGTITASGPVMGSYANEPIARIEPATTSPDAQLVVMALFGYFAALDAIAGVAGLSRCTCRR